MRADGLYAPTKRSTLELLAAVQAVTKLEQADIVFCDLVNEVPRCSELAESKFIMVFIVQNIHERCQERMQILKRRIFCKMLG